MDYTDIHSFLTIASSPSLSKAAEVLYISQPTLSHRLTLLEKELGAELIVRKKGVRSIELTDAGRHFLTIAHKWERLWQETQKINLEQSVVPLRISNVDSLNLFFMSRVVSVFLKNHPNARLNLFTMRSNVAYTALENHETDIGFISNPHFFRKVKTLPLFTEEFAFVCGMGGNYGDSVHPSELNSADEIYIPWSNSFLMWHDYWFGNNPDIKVALDNMSLLEQLLKVENTWAIVPATVARILLQQKEYRKVAMEHPPEPRTCYAILGDETRNEHMVTCFLEEFRKVAAEFPEIKVLPLEEK